MVLDSDQSDVLDENEIPAMTLEGARQTAAGMARRFGRTFVVFRYLGWPSNVWGVRRRDQLAENAMVHEYFTAPAATARVVEGQRPLF